MSKSVNSFQSIESTEDIIEGVEIDSSLNELVRFINEWEGKLNEVLNIYDADLEKEQPLAEEGVKNNSFVKYSKNNLSSGQYVEVKENIDINNISCSSFGDGPIVNFNNTMYGTSAEFNKTGMVSINDGAKTPDELIQTQNNISSSELKEINSDDVGTNGINENNLADTFYQSLINLAKRQLGIEPNQDTSQANINELNVNDYIGQGSEKEQELRGILGSMDISNNLIEDNVIELGEHEKLNASMNNNIIQAYANWYNTKNPTNKLDIIDFVEISDDRLNKYHATSFIFNEEQNFLTPSDYVFKGDVEIEGLERANLADFYSFYPKGLNFYPSSYSFIPHRIKIAQFPPRYRLKMFYLGQIKKEKLSKRMRLFLEI